MGTDWGRERIASSLVFTPRNKFSCTDPTVKFIRGEPYHN